MTENDWRERVVKQAQSWLGWGEHDGSHRLILDIYNRIDPLPRGYRMRDTDPWCAAFVSAVGAACGLCDIIFPECACDPMITAFKAAGRWIGDSRYAAKPGDIIFYDWNGDRSSDHVGIVESSGASCYQIIEGNYSDAVKRRVITRGNGQIIGFGLPDYAGKADASEDLTGSEDTGEDTSSSPAEPTRETCSVKLPVLEQGDTGEAVRAAQLLLIGRGCSCGPYGADGDFGPATYGGVISFQRRRRLEPDGVIGPLTWEAMLKLGQEDNYART